MAQGHEVLILTPRRGGPAPDGYGVPVVELAPEPYEEALRSFVADDPAGGALLAAELRGALYVGSLATSSLSTRRRRRMPRAPAWPIGSEPPSCRASLTSHGCLRRPYRPNRIPEPRNDHRKSAGSCSAASLDDVEGRMTAAVQDEVGGDTGS